MKYGIEKTERQKKAKNACPVFGNEKQGRCRQNRNQSADGGDEIHPVCTQKS
ncbi:MAG: hypothetical protein IKV98_04185 [Clostridia bacterium]|jgi:predicted RNA-binding Zn-ribbon protein involved in translation (DUF1610 family)|nr:hypothetical protein [Clostridia bacterium]